MNTSRIVGRLGAASSAVLVGAGYLVDSTALVALGVVASCAGVIAWYRSTAPHNHWAGLPKRKL